MSEYIQLDNQTGLAAIVNVEDISSIVKQGKVPEGYCQGEYRLEIQLRGCYVLRRIIYQDPNEMEHQYKLISDLLLNRKVKIVGFSKIY